ncbi:MAG: hypothetical protein V2A58_05465, partial [Planctomycetota bacterium]
SALTSVVPEFKLIISHAYGSLNRTLAGRGTDRLSEVEYGLLPAFCDGVLEGCGEKGLLIESGEATYGTMTYAFYKAWCDYDRLSALRISAVPELVQKSYRQATAMWPDFRSDTNGWHGEDVEKNHFSPERMKHALHNALAATDEYVWTWSWHAHWWPNRGEVLPWDKNKPLPKDYLPAMGEAYLREAAGAREPMSLDWHPERTTEKAYDAPGFDAEKAFASLGDGQRIVAGIPDEWLFHVADSSNPAAYSWGIPLSAYGEAIEKVYDWRPIKVGDYWENQGFPIDGTGVYRATFGIPKDVRGKRLCIAVAGVAGRATLYLASEGVRERPVGRCEGETLSLFDVTEALDLAGDNCLTLVVASPSGPGGVYGAVKLVSREKGRGGYVELRGKETGKWFHWLRSSRLGKSLAGLSLENTVEARVRVPAEEPFTAQLWCTTEDGGWHAHFGPKGVTFGDKWFANTSTEWHTYRVVIARREGRYVQTLFVDGAQKAQVTADPMKSEEPRGSAIGFGVGWGNKETAPIKMDVDYIRWANRPFTPADEAAAKAGVPEAQERKDVFWDGAYEGDVMPDADGWKWWYDWDGRPYTRIVYEGAALDVTDTQRLTVVYDWRKRTGGRLVPRDVPRLDQENEVHAEVAPGEVAGAGESFAAKLTVRSAKEVGYGWPAVTITDLAARDWSAFAAVAVRIHNPTDETQEIGISVRDADRNVWYVMEKFAPGETKTLGGTLEEIRAKVLVSDIWTVTLYTRHTEMAETFLVSPIYLVPR